MPKEMMDFVERTIEDLKRASLGHLRDEDRSRMRGVLHDALARATKQFAPLRQNQFLISIGKLHHYKCPNEIQDGNESAYMDLIDADLEAPVFRCRLCGTEVAVLLDFVTAAELSSKPKARSTKKRRKARL